MLFTAQSKPATNIVTTGSGFSIKLQERDDTEAISGFQNIGDDYDAGRHYDHGVYTGNAETTFKGLDFQKHLMGAKLAKHPRVIRLDTDGADAYLRVKAEIVVEDPTGDSVEFTELSYAEQQVALAIWYDSPTSDSVSFNWLKSDVANGVWYYYYVNDASAEKPELKIFSPAANAAAPNATQTLYDIVRMSDYSENDDTDLYNAFVNLRGYAIGVKLTAQAVQSANNEPHESNYDYMDFFTDVE
jgi:hypothetical protein